jgi:hypothetical protein
MSFFEHLFSFFNNTNITVTLKPYNNMQTLSGFTKNNNYTLRYTFNKGSTIKQIMDNVNKYRSPVAQIRQCYINGFRIQNTHVINDNCVIHVSV